MRHPRLLFVMTLLVAAASGWALAQGQPPQGPPPEGRPGEAPPEHRGPPPEALAACKTAQAGADCSFSHGSATVKGVCGAPEGRPLACRPHRPPAGGASRPEGR